MHISYLCTHVNAAIYFPENIRTRLLLPTHYNKTIFFVHKQDALLFQADAVVVGVSRLFGHLLVNKPKCLVYNLL